MLKAHPQTVHFEWIFEYELYGRKRKEVLKESENDPIFELKVEHEMKGNLSCLGNNGIQGATCILEAFVNTRLSKYMCYKNNIIT